MKTMQQPYSILVMTVFKGLLYIDMVLSASIFRST